MARSYIKNVQQQSDVYKVQSPQKNSRQPKTAMFLTGDEKEQVEEASNGKKRRIGI